jgi:hypothetical protein
VDKGRSKSCVVVMGVQDLALLAASQGEAFARALPGMIGTHIFTQAQIGPTRDQWSKMLGERRVMWTTPGAGPGQSPVVHEESWPVVTPADLTTKLGYRKDPREANGFKIRAMACLGEDYWLLDWPGVVMPKKRRSHVPAPWTLPVTTKADAGANAFAFTDAPYTPSSVTAASGRRAKAARGSGSSESESGQPPVTADRRSKRVAQWVPDVAQLVRSGLASMKVAA